MLRTSPTFAVPGMVGTRACDAATDRAALAPRADCRERILDSSCARSSTMICDSTARCFRRRSARAFAIGLTSDDEKTGADAIDGRFATKVPGGASAVTVTPVTLAAVGDTDCTPIRYDSLAVDAPNCRQNSAVFAMKCC